MLVEGREDRAAPRRRGGVVVRERDLPQGQDDMASKVNERMNESNRKEITTTKSEVTESPEGNTVGITMKIKREERRNCHDGAKTSHESHDGFAEMVRRGDFCFLDAKVPYIIRPYV